MRAIDAVGESSRPQLGTRPPRPSRPRRRPRPCPRPSTTSTRSTVGLDIDRPRRRRTRSRPGTARAPHPAPDRRRARDGPGRPATPREDDGALGRPRVDVEALPTRRRMAPRPVPGRAARRVAVVEASRPVAMPGPESIASNSTPSSGRRAARQTTSSPPPPCLTRLVASSVATRATVALRVGVELERGRATRARHVAPRRPGCASVDDDASVASIMPSA